MKKKTQMWYMDFIMGVTIFTLMIILAFRYITTNLGQTTDTSYLSYEADKASKYFLSAGIPGNWTKEDVVVVGFTTDNKLNTTKVGQFANMTEDDYDNAKYYLGIKSDFAFSFFDVDYNILNISGRTYFGKPGLSDINLTGTDYDNYLTVIRFLVMQDGNISQIVAMKLVVWKE